MYLTALKTLIVDYINKGQYVKLMDQSTSKYYVYDANGKKVGKDTYSYRKMNPNYTQQYQIKGKLENDLKNPTIPAWQISNEFGM